MTDTMPKGVEVALLLAIAAAIGAVTLMYLFGEIPP